MPSFHDTSSSTQGNDQDPPPPFRARSTWVDALGRAGSRSGQIVLIAVVVIGATWLLVQASTVVLSVIVALIVASAVYPVVQWLHDHRWPRLLATVATLLTLGMVAGGIMTAIVFAIRSQWDELVASAMQGWNQLTDYVSTGPLPVDSSLLNEASNKGIEFVTSDAFLGGTVRSIGNVTEGVTGTILALITLFFFLKDGPRIWHFVLRWFAAENRAKLAESGDRTVQVLGNYMRGTAIIAVVDSVPVGIALALMGVPLALPLAVIVFLGAFLPLIGATITGTLAALVALVTNGPVAALVVIGVVIAVNQLEGHLLQPIVMGHALNLHALVVLLALAVGTLIGGVFGALLAVPLTAVTWSVIQIWSSAYHSGYDPVLGEDPVAIKSRPSAKATLSQRWKYRRIRNQSDPHHEVLSPPQEGTQTRQDPSDTTTSGP